MYLNCRAPSQESIGQTCRAPLGEATEPLRFVGAFERYEMRKLSIDPPRDVRRCKTCGWYNLFMPLRTNGRPKRKLKPRVQT